MVGFNTLLLFVVQAKIVAEMAILMCHSAVFKKILNCPARLAPTNLTFVFLKFLRSNSCGGPVAGRTNSL